MHELLIRCGQSLPCFPVQLAQSAHGGCDRPILITLGAWAIALLPLQALQANPIVPTENPANQSHVIQQVQDPNEAASAIPNLVLHQKISVQTASASTSTNTPVDATASVTTQQPPEPAPSVADLLPINADTGTEPSASFEVAQDTAPETIPFYGEAGSRRWYVQGGGATNLDSDESRNFGLVGAGISHFFLDGNSINLELNGMAFEQPGDDAVGLNLAAILRWDFIRQQNWSLYIDGGAGLLGTTDSVPSDGSSFNFTPQVGGGATIRLNERNRLMVGVRWHHISNANSFDSNPGQDLIFGYVGINFPR